MSDAELVKAMDAAYWSSDQPSDVTWLGQMRAALAIARAAILEEAAKAVEKRSIELDKKECCGRGVDRGDHEECCGDPLYMISNEDAAAAIRALVKEKTHEP